MEQPARTPLSFLNTKPNALPRLCGDCGYELTGLPPAGTCPECGQQYAAGTIILAGWAAGNRAKLWNSSGTSAILPTVSVLVWLLAVYERLRRHVTPEALFFALAYSIIAVICIVRFGVSRARSHPPCSVRLTESGYGQADGFGRTVLEPWQWNTWYRIVRHRSRYRLRLGGNPKRFDFSGPVQNVDLVLDCTPAQAEWLKRAIEEFRATAYGRTKP